MTRAVLIDERSPYLSPLKSLRARSFIINKIVLHTICFQRRLKDYFDKDIIPQNSSPMLQLLSNHHTPEAKMKCFENSYFFATTHDLFTVKGFREVIIEGQISANANSFYCYVCVRIYTI